MNSSVPIVGEFQELVANPLSLLVRARAHGEVVKLISPDKEFPYLLSNPEHIREILITKQASFIKSKSQQVLKVAVGEGILTSEGEQHRQDRQLMQPFFNMKHLSMYTNAMVQHAQKLIDSWQPGDHVDMTKAMMDVTLEIITDTMFGTTVSSQDEDNVREVVDGAHKMIMEKIRMEGHESPEDSMRRNVQIQQSTEKMDQLIYSIIEQGRANPDPNRHDLLSSLLKTGMSNRELRDQIMTIFLAGHETTANTLSWTWYLLAQHPEIEAKFHEELDTVLQGAAPTYETIQQLHYTNLIIQESMRLYPAVWTIGRIVKEDVRIGDYDFKAGESVMMSQFAVHRDPKWYANPDEFLPERFDGDLLKTIPTYAYFPFGGGPRVCIGNNFALLEATLLLATIGRKFKLVLADDANVQAEPLITLIPKGLKMNVVNR